jgi:hypothetical protein
MFGVSPPRPEGLAFDLIETDAKAMDGAATLKRVAIRFPIGGGTFSFQLTLFVPNQRSGAVPVFLQINHRGIENTDPTRQTQSGFWPAEEVIARLEPHCGGFLCTYVDKEGMLQGTDLDWYKRLRSATNHEITAAGGITTLDDIRALAELNVHAALGMAIYTGRLDLAELAEMNKRLA